MISCPDVRKDVIRQHYNISTLFYWLLWGRHIHHGYWEANESPQVAAQQLTDRLAHAAGIRGGERIADIGCGMGGSSVHLAQRFGCHVTGVTLSPFQRRWAACAAMLGGVSGRASFLCQDAETTHFDSGSLACCLECGVHGTSVRQARIFQTGSGLVKARRPHGDLRVAGR
ncbi:MAG UNVERIFIED_CONTAM: class I SAM-dependent methyltransferase [Planctomycetaceae bacterium]|jgi:tocopherol O-methyltransferase